MVQMRSGVGPGSLPVGPEKLERRSNIFRSLNLEGAAMSSLTLSSLTPSGPARDQRRSTPACAARAPTRLP